MTFFWIILGVVLLFLLSDYIWILLLVIAAILILHLVNKAKKEREQAALEWEKKQAAISQSSDLTHKFYYDTSSAVKNTTSSCQTTNAISCGTGSAAASPSANVRSLDSFVRYGITAPPIYQECPMVYRFPNVSVSNVNRSLLSSLVQSKNFKVTLYADENGDVLLKADNCTVAKLEDRVQMCIDWLHKGFPVICEFAVFAQGKEKVALFFYKNEEHNLVNNRCEVAKLTSCMSASKQETIAFLEKGQKLFIELDDNNKPYVRDIEYNPIGNLPAKYNKLYEDDMIIGVFFDHTETKVSEDFDKEDKEIPFVRIYLAQ